MEIWMKHGCYYGWKNLIYTAKLWENRYKKQKPLRKELLYDCISFLKACATVTGVVGSFYSSKKKSCISTISPLPICTKSLVPFKNIPNDLSL